MVVHFTCKPISWLSYNYVAESDTITIVNERKHILYTAISNFHRILAQDGQFKRVREL